MRGGIHTKNLKKLVPQTAKPSPLSSMPRTKGKALASSDATQSMVLPSLLARLDSNEKLNLLD